MSAEAMQRYLEPAFLADYMWQTGIKPQATCMHSHSKSCSLVRIYFCHRSAPGLMPQVCLIGSAVQEMAISCLHARNISTMQVGVCQTSLVYKEMAFRLNLLGSDCVDGVLGLVYAL